MRKGIEVRLGPGDRERLEAVIGSGNSAQKHVWRARIVLLSADGVGTMAIQRRTGKGKPTIWRWQARFMAKGVDGLLHDATRPGGKPPLTPAAVERVVEMTLLEPPGETTHWTGRAMARAAGVSHRSVQRIWAAHGLKPHRVRTFKLSTDPKFAAKVQDVVGLYVDPPEHALVLSVDEKSQIQALDRTQPGLPMKKGRCGTMTHDYKRHGTTTLFAALDVLEGRVIGQCMARHRHQEFIRFLTRSTARPRPAGTPSDRRQLCDAQASQSPRLARTASQVPFPLHPDLGFVAQRRGGVLRQADQAAPQARRLQRHRRSPGSHQPVPRRDQ
jgi:transposase